MRQYTRTFFQWWGGSEANTTTIRDPSAANFFAILSFFQPCMVADGFRYAVPETSAHTQAERKERRKEGK